MFREIIGSRWAKLCPSTEFFWHRTSNSAKSKRLNSNDSDKREFTEKTSERFADGRFIIKSREKGRFKNDMDAGTTFKDKSLQNTIRSQILYANSTKSKEGKNPKLRQLEQFEMQKNRF